MDVDRPNTLESERTPRVNSARMPDYLGRVVRLVCKVSRVSGTSAVVTASDLGQINVRAPHEGAFEDTYLEIIGLVEDETTIKLKASINLGSDLDMELVNSSIEMMHDPQFKDIF